MTIKNLIKLLPLLLSFTLLLLLTACGSDEDPAPAGKSAKMTIGIQRIDGNPGTNVGSVALNITLPAAFTLKTDVDGIPTSTKMLVDGLLVDGACNYVHPTLTFALIKSDGTSFPTGDLISFSLPLQEDEVLMVATDFLLNLTEVTEIAENGDVTIQTESYKVTLTVEEI